MLNRLCLKRNLHLKDGDQLDVKELDLGLITIL
jgi:hypothetical protein